MLPVPIAPRPRGSGVHARFNATFRLQLVHRINNRRPGSAERLHAGNQWTDSGLVFTTEFGTPVEPRNILRAIETAAAKAGSRTWVSTPFDTPWRWLEPGVHIKPVADLLGHSSNAFVAR